MIPFGSSSGNDVTAVLMAGLPVVLCAFMQLRDGVRTFNYWKYALSAGLTAICLMLIGTKTAFIADIATVGVLALCALWRLIAKKDARPLRRLGVVFAVMAAVFLLIALISSESIFSEIRTSFESSGVTWEREGAATALLSGRQNKLKRAYRMFREGGLYTLLFGVGRGTQTAIIEMDVFEVIIYYGLFGALCMLWLYLKLGLEYVVRFFKNLRGLQTDLTPVACLVALGLCAGYLIIAGHILFSVTSGFYFSYLLLYGKAVYAKGPEEMRIF